MTPQPPHTMIPTNNQPEDPESTLDQALSDPPPPSTYTPSMGEDPLWMKCKSAVFRGAGAAQSKLGSVTGMNGLEHRGQEWESWASRTADQADVLTEQGAPSRIHGEYNRWMGYLGKALGHVSGDEEMQVKGTQRTEQANDEIEQARRKSSA
ncbi:hypothetical protein [Absidia glauca]|uniref:CsbD-like domain-containing protein n=1 Tax=Absidia glauca TaxID=4829 RepID=A0A168QH54_ABSGL|nr:hypothetical protein [Absidia glauca]